MKTIKLKPFKSKFLLLCVVCALLLISVSCSSAPATTTSKVSSPAASTTVLTIQEPIEIVSLYGPLPVINPGGATLDLTLKNVSKEAIQSLDVTLNLNRPFNFLFDVTLPVPFLPGKTMTSEQTLIGAEFSADTDYPLRISGAYRSGPTFDYVKRVQIQPPPTKK